MTTSSTTDIEREHKMVQKLILEVRAQLEQVEGMQPQNAKFGSTGSEHYKGTPRARKTYQIDEVEGGMVSPSSVDGQLQHNKILDLQSQLSTNINKLLRSERKIKEMVTNLPLNKREHWKREVDNITEESRFLRRSVDKYLKTINDHEKDRELLLGSYKGFQNDDAIRNHQEMMNELHSQKDSMNRSLQVIEQMKEVGAGVLEMLGQQSDILRGVHRKVMDMGVHLGVVQSTLRMISRRHLMDRWVVYIGMFLVMALLVLVFWWKFM